MNPQRWLTRTLRSSPYGEKVTRILAAAIESVDPTQAVLNHLRRQNNNLEINGMGYNLDSIEKVWVVGFGKASIPMGTAVMETLGDKIGSGILVTKFLSTEFQLAHPKIILITGAHPVPDESSLEGSQSVLQLLSRTTRKDLVIFLISGGGSALLTSPVPGVSLDDIRALTSSLLSCGASINEINTLRKHLSQVKGGQLARWAAPAQVTTLILSDVVGDPLDVIASGPTVPDPTTFQDALNILIKYQLLETIPRTIKRHLHQGVAGEIPETPKVGDPIFDRVQNTIIGNNFQAAKVAENTAADFGFNTLLLSTSLQGEARTAGSILSAIAREIDSSGHPIPRPACVIIGGETTVLLGGDGLGGRNQELALGAVTELANLPNTLFITMATDGDDGPTDAAGAVVTGETLGHALDMGLDPNESLKRNDSYHFFEALGDLLKPGPTGTNVCDLTFLFQY